MRLFNIECNRILYLCEVKKKKYKKLVDSMLYKYNVRNKDNNCLIL